MNEDLTTNIGDTNVCSCFPMQLLILVIPMCVIMDNTNKITNIDNNNAITNTGNTNGNTNY